MIIRKLYEDIDADYEKGYQDAIKALKKKLNQDSPKSEWDDLDIERDQLDDIEDMQREVSNMQDSIEDEEENEESSSNSRNQGQGTEEDEELKKDLKDLSDELDKQAQNAADGKELSDEEIKKLQDKLDSLSKKFNNSSFSKKTTKDDDTHTKNVDDREIRVQKIKDFLKDEKNAIDSRMEDAEAKRADKKELQKKWYNQTTSLRFLTSLEKLIKTQVSRRREYTWKRPSKNIVPGSDVIRRGRASVENKNIPLIVVYYDRSASWNDPAKTAVGDKAISMLRREFERKGLIKLELLYFGNEVSSNPNDVGTGTTACQKILDDIARRKATNVIILTDSDMDRFPELFTRRVTVPGGVYFLFKGGVCNTIMQYLKGEQLTEAYNLDA